MLVVRPDEIGDMVLTIPLVRELRRLLPRASITLVVKPSARNLLDICPYVDEVLACDWTIDPPTGAVLRHLRTPILAYRHLWQHYWRALRFAARYLWHRHIDLAIVPRWDRDSYHSAYVAYFSGAPHRIGYSEDVTREKKRVNTGYNRLFTHVLRDRTPKHEVQHNLDVVRFLGASAQDEHLELWTDEMDEAHIQQFLTAHGVDSGDVLVAFGPGAREAKRMWPLDRFIEVGEWFKGEERVRIVVVGGPGEESLGQGLRQRLGDVVVDATGQMTLRQTEALLRRCHLYVGNDTGLMHLAAAAKIPVVELSCHPKAGVPQHPNSPHRFGPWDVPHVVLQPETACAPCLDGCEAKRPHCILSISPSVVKEAVAELLARTGVEVAVEKVRVHAR